MPENAQEADAAAERAAAREPAAGTATVREEERPAPETVPEIGGQKGPEPTRYGDWEKDGRCTDF